MGRILIVDDDDQVRAVFRRIVEGGGHEVIEASNGRIGSQLFKKDPTDLIIMDIIMPEQEGLETISELLTAFPDVKIIAVSGGGRINAEDYLKIAKDLGAVYTFEKPIDPEQLLDAVDNLVQGKV
ncbi:MAG: response regulator [Planctomycetes bacterium]|nr:response regulator [Planctomycetota bacterium]